MPNEINQRIATSRKLAGFTQASAAQRLGMKRNTYARMELHGNPGAEMLMRLAELYDVSVNFLIYGETEGETENENELSQTLPPPSLITQPDAHARNFVRFASGINEKILPPQPYIPTNSELDLIKMFHYLSKEDKEAVKADVFERYKKTKAKE